MSRSKRRTGAQRRATEAVGRALAAAAVLGLLLVAPVPAASAAPPADEKESARPAQRPVKSIGPRRMKLGGTRAVGARKIEHLGGAKIPIKSLSDRNLRPRFSLHRQREAMQHDPRDTARPSGGFVAPRRSPPVTGISPAASALRADLIRAAFLSGSGVRNAAFERAVREHGFGDDVEIGPRIRTGPDADADRRRSAAGLLGQFSRGGTLAPGAAATLGLGVAPIQGEVALEVARRELGGQGYTQIELGRGDYAFVRGANEAQVQEIQRRAADIRSKADRHELEYEWAVRCHLNRRYRPECDDDLSPWRSLDELQSQGIDPFLAHGAPAEEPPPQPGFDAAVAALERSRYGDAVIELESYLAGEPEDMEVVRLLGVVQLLDGQTAAGIESIGRSYEADPYLAARPIGSEVLAPRPGDLRRALSAVVGHAHRTHSPHAWLTAAVLMRAEGRPEQAVKMLERAIAGGLDERVGNEMMLALRP